MVPAHGQAHHFPRLSAKVACQLEPFTDLCSLVHREQLLGLEPTSWFSFLGF